MWLVVAHGIEVLLLLAVPILLARRIAKGRWRGAFGLGLLTFLFAELLRIGLAKAGGYAIGSGVDLGLRGEHGPWIAGALAGLSAALTDTGMRVYAFRGWFQRDDDADVEPLPDRDLARLHGLGMGGAQAMLSGVLVLLMATIAIVLEGKTMGEVEAMGFEGRTAIRVGARVYAWWESSPLDAVLAGVGELLMLAMHVGLSAALFVAVRGRRGRGWGLGAAAALAQLVVVTCVSALAATESSWVTLAAQAGGAAAGLLLWRVARSPLSE